jgi:hypothetical protein
MIMLRHVRILSTVAVAATLSASALAAQTPAHDPSAQLQEVLPADVAERVLARIADARARQLPAAALENRALKFAARGVAPSDIERSVFEQADRMGQARELLVSRRGSADGEEIDAAAEAMRKGVSGESVSELARTAPSGRSLAVPLHVLGQLVERGLPSDAALQRVHERLMARATDAELQQLPAAAGQRRPAQTGREIGAARQAGNPGGGARPAAATRPTTPAGRP